MASVPTPALAGAGGFGQLVGMVTASEIRDRESLKLWLDGRPREDAVTIAQRAACRVLPVFGGALGARWAREHAITAALALRIVLCAGTAQTIPTVVVSRAAHQTLSASGRTAYETGRATDAAFAADSILGAGDVAGATDQDKLISTTDCVVVDAETVLTSLSARTELWDQIREDARSVEANGDPFRTPLWSERVPDWFSSADTRMRAVWSEDPPEHWTFWIRWWDGVLSGRQVDWELQREVALIPDDIWQQGPDAVAEAIRVIETERGIAQPDVPDVRQALSALATGSEADVERVGRALVAHRSALPPTMDAVLGLISLEIERLQKRNYRDAEDAVEARRQIGVLSTLYKSVEGLQALVPQKAEISADKAEQAEKLVRLFVQKFKEWPRTNAEDLVDSVYRLGLVGASAALLPMIGVPAPWAAAAGIAIFGNKKIADALKVAKDAQKD